MTFENMKKEICRLSFEEKMTSIDISKKMKVSDSMVRYILSQTIHENTIRKLMMDGLSFRQIVEELNLSEEIVRKVYFA